MPLHRKTIQIGNASHPHYYLCHYRPKSTGRDTLSRSLLKFKLGQQPDLSGWIDCSLYALAGAGTPILPHTTIIRALHHEETAVPGDSPASLDRLGRALAALSQSVYQPSLLRKSRTTREIKGFTREQRVIELQDLYYMAEPALPLLPQQSPARWSRFNTGHPDIPEPSPPDPDPILMDNILIIDDVLTTGTTIRSIIAALRSRYPRSALSIFTLARAAYDTPGNATVIKGQTYQLEQGMDWMLAEDARLPTPVITLPRHQL